MKESVEIRHVRPKSMTTRPAAIDPSRNVEAVVGMLVGIMECCNGWGIQKCEVSANVHLLELVRTLRHVATRKPVTNRVETRKPKARAAHLGAVLRNRGFLLGKE
ncbi:hypothetical protein VNO80_06332 [Phaseolus coccineus]|uniref:Uncharacterized protein n=1 Tax=Phaseolus coccineus TaxID=3886 RepID=A0AAN9NHV3_PHACN